MPTNNSFNAMPIIFGGAWLAVGIAIHLTGWHFWRKASLGHSLRLYRKIMTGVGTTGFLLSGTVLLADSLSTAWDPSWQHFWQVGIPLIRIGSWSAVIALLGSFFARGKSRICFLLSVGLIAFYWLGAGMSA